MCVLTSTYVHVFRTEKDSSLSLSDLVLCTRFLTGPEVHYFSYNDLSRSSWDLRKWPYYAWFMWVLVKSTWVLMFVQWVFLPTEPFWISRFVMASNEDLTLLTSDTRLFSNWLTFSYFLISKLAFSYNYLAQSTLPFKLLSQNYLRACTSRPVEQ